MEKNNISKQLNMVSKIMHIFKQPCFICDSDKKFLSANNEFLKLMGLSKEEVAHRLVDELLTETSFIVVQKVAKMAVEKKVTIEMTTVLKTKKGVEISVQMTLFAVAMPEQSKSIFVVVLKDISTFHQTEKQWQQIFKNSNEAFFIMETTGNMSIVDANEAAVTLFDAGTIETLCHHSPIDLSSSMQEGGILSSKLAVEKVQQALKQGWSKFKWVHKRLDSSIFYAEVLLSPVTINNTPLIHAIIRDISLDVERQQELENSEKRLREILDESIAGLAIVDSFSGKITDVNFPAIKILKASNQADLIGQQWSQFYGSSLIEETDVDFREAVLTRIDGVVTSVRILSKTRIFNHHTCKIFSFVDISSEKAAELSRLHLERELQQSNKMEAIGTLAAGVAHEINTPIQFIGNNTEFLIKGISKIFDYTQKLEDLYLSNLTLSEDKDQAVAEFEALKKKNKIDFMAREIPVSLTQSLEGVSRVAEIVKAMKDFSHSGIDEKLEEDINKAIETTIIISRNEWKYVAEMKLELAPDLSLVECFIGDIKQVILNLIVNASHAINDQNKILDRPMGLIVIKTANQPESIVISIKDNGTGIKESIRSKVFEHFFTTKEVGVGTGQGLSLAYQSVIQKHGGDIRFDSTEGEGTTFFIRLPIKDLNVSSIDIDNENEKR